MVDRPSKKKQLAYLIAFLVCSAVAGYMFWSNSRGLVAEMPNAPEDRQLFMCLKCGHTAMLTPREVAESMVRTASDMTRPERTSARQATLECPKCKEIGLVRAHECSQCGNPYIQDTRDGNFHIICRNCEKVRDAQGAQQLPEPPSNPEDGG